MRLPEKSADFRAAILLVAASVLLSTGGCTVKKYPYHYLSFEGDMSIVENGVPEGFWTWGAARIPVRYVLERSRYTLYAGIDNTSAKTAVVF